MRQVAAILVLPAAYLVFLVVHSPDQSLLQSDSLSYIEFSATRSSGYPFFLTALKALVSGMKGYVAVQVTLYAGCVALVGWAIYQVGRSVAIAVLAQALLLCNPFVNSYHFTILSESLFLSVSGLFVAAMIFYLRRPSLSMLAIVSISAGFATAVKPTGIALLLVPIVLALLQQRAPKSLVAHAVVAVACIALAVALEAAYYKVHHEGPRQSLLPLHMLAKGGMINVPDAAALLAAAPPHLRPLEEALETGLAPMRRFLAEAPNAAGRCRMAGNYETFVQYQFAIPIRRDLVAQGGQQELIKAGLLRIQHAPLDYLRLVGDNLYCLWTIWVATDAEKKAYGDYLAGNRPIPFDDRIFDGLATAPSPPFAVLARPILFAIALILGACGVAVLWAVMTRRELNIWISVAGLCGLSVHASLLATAMAGIAIPRYTLALWVPLTVGCLAFALPAMVWGWQQVNRIHVGRQRSA